MPLCRNQAVCPFFQIGMNFKEKVIVVKQCLIVVDYQNDFVTGTLGFPKAMMLERQIAEKIQQYRDRGDDILFTFDTHDDSYLHTQEGRMLPVAHCIRGTDGHDLYGQVRDRFRQEDTCFYKNAFGSSELFDYLRETRYARIELVGVVSNICVISNAVLAKTAQPETPVTVDASCTASHDDRLNEAALDVMAGLQIGIENRVQ